MHFWMFHAILSAQKKFYPTFFDLQIFIHWAMGEARRHTMLSSIPVFLEVQVLWAKSWIGEVLGEMEQIRRKRRRASHKTNIPKSLLEQRKQPQKHTRSLSHITGHLETRYNNKNFKIVFAQKIAKKFDASLTHFSHSPRELNRLYSRTNVHHKDLVLTLCNLWLHIFETKE